MPSLMRSIFARSGTRASRGAGGTFAPRTNPLEVIHSGYRILRFRESVVYAPWTMNEDREPSLHGLLITDLGPGSLERATG